MRRVLDAEFIVSHRTALDLTVHNSKAKPVTGWALNALAHAIQQRWFRDPAA